MPKSYVVYLRRSTSDDKHQQYSIDAQEKICLSYAQRNHLQVADIIREEHSAKIAGKRPKFLQMLKDLKERKYDGVIVHNVDRLLRSIGDFASIDELRTTQSELHFVDGSYPNTPEGNMMLGINVVFAKWYVEKLGKEVKKGFRESLEQGRFPREAPVGYTDKGNGIKALDPVSAPLVRLAYDLYASGKYSVESLTAVMKKRGLKTKRGDKWNKDVSVSSMHRIISNPFYVGKTRMWGQEYAGKHPSLLPQELFDRVQTILKRKNCSRPSGKIFAFRGMVHCSCGSLLSPYDKKGHAYYGCFSKKCSQSTTREERIDEAILPIIEKIYFDDDEMEKTREAMKKLEGLVTVQRDASLQSIESRKKKLYADLETARRKVLSGTFDDEDFRAEKHRISTEEQQINKDEREIQKMEVTRLEQTYRFLELARRAPLTYRRANPEEKREIVMEVFLELDVHDKNVVSYKLKDAFEPIVNRDVILCGGSDGIRTRDLIRDRDAL